MNSKSLLNRKAQIAFGSAIVILLVMGAFSYHSMVESSESNRWARHTDEVLASLQQLSFATTKVESSSRGFALSGQESYLETYRSSVLNAQQQERIARELTADNARQQDKLTVLEALIAQKLEYTDFMIALRRT